MFTIYFSNTLPSSVLAFPSCLVKLNGEQPTVMWTGACEGSRSRLLNSTMYLRKLIPLLLASLPFRSWSRVMKALAKRSSPVETIGRTTQSLFKPPNDSHMQVPVLSSAWDRGEPGRGLLVSDSDQLLADDPDLSLISGRGATMLRLHMEKPSISSVALPADSSLVKLKSGRFSPCFPWDLLCLIGRRSS